MPEEPEEKNKQKNAKNEKKKTPEKEDRFRIPEKISKVKLQELTPTKQTEFDILDPSKREDLQKLAHETPSFNQPEDLAVIEQRMMTQDFDSHRQEAEARRLEEKHASFDAEARGLPFINLYGFPISIDALKKISESQARESQVVPFFFDSIELRVGTPNPDNAKQKDIIEAIRKSGLLVTVYFISKSSFEGALRYYKDLTLEQAVHHDDHVEVTEELMGELSDHIEELKNVKTRLQNLSVTKIINIIFGAAVKLKASDVHFEPEEKDVRLRYRIDGVLQDVMKVEPNVYKQVLSRIKLISKMKVNITTTPQDGRFSITLPTSVLDVRVSILPSGYGEAVVSRLLGVGAVALDIEKLGLQSYTKDIVLKTLEKPYGMLLVTGPTGSGKTTTLYSFLNYLNKPDVKIITLEDPIEYRLTGIQQTQIDREAGLDFAAGLRSILRHDPDIVLVGEIRDLETAEIAINAAQTGHIVFSTLHTNDAAGVLPRLINMGLRQFVIAPAVNAIIAQRLVRVLCNDCKEAYTPDTAMVEFVRAQLGPDLMAKFVPKEWKLYRAKRCDKCATGYRGRMGIFEIFEMDDDMEKLIMRSATVAEIREAAVAKGMVLMKQDGIMKAILGLTTIDEVRRVAAT